MIKKIITTLFIFLIFFNIIFINTSFALTATEIKNQINDTNEQIKRLEKEIAQYQSQIAKTSTEANTLTKTIKELTITRNKLLKEKEQIEAKITTTGLVILSITDDIDKRENTITKSQKVIAQLINEINKHDNTTFVEKVILKPTFNKLSQDYNNLLSINDTLKEKILSLQGEKKLLTEDKEIKESEKNNLNKLKNNLFQKEQVVLITKKEKDNLLIQTKNKESEYQKLLLERQKSRDAFEKKLSVYEDQLEFILNPKLLPKTGSSVLSFPLKSVFITQLFGYTSASKRLYKSGTHSGIDLRASIGTEVLSMGDGVVLGVGDTDIYCKGASFGKWVFIKYNNGLSTTFGHLSVISVKKDDKVKTGDMVALSGNTGHTTGPHLHVTVYASDGVKIDSVPSVSCNGKSFIMPIAASSSYLDPMLYLPKVESNMIKK